MPDIVRETKGQPRVIDLGEADSGDRRTRAYSDVRDVPSSSRSRRHISALSALFRPKAIWRFLTDKRSPMAPKIMLGATLIYLVLPIDLVPDFAPVVGWLDDLGLVGIAMAWLGSQVAKYENARMDRTAGGSGPGQDGPTLPSTVR